MKTSLQRLLYTTFVVLSLAGCATPPKIDWDSRVGNYTYDHSVEELGMPTQMGMLADGSKVAQWYSGRPSAEVAGVGTGISVGLSGTTAVRTPMMESRTKRVQLTFGPDGVLRSWSR
ncbi:MAG: hypothetical protein ABI042_19825 [Verrucomicrobiota bacterium]